jgi:CheY-like chemotaxis protein
MKKALVVEDHPDMLDILTLLMERLGFAVISANNGKEGVEKAFKEKPYLILMDIMMPVMDGREATRIIRSKKKTKNIPILATTGLFRESDLKSCIEAGCNDYILKPFAPNELASRIERLLPTPAQLSSPA